MRNRGTTIRAWGLPIGLVAMGLVCGCANGLAPAQGTDGEASQENENDNQSVSSPCGNGLLDPGESCDDGNALAGDGCSAQCQVEPCGEGTCPDGCCDVLGQCHPGTETTFCGEGGAACDDCAVGVRACEDRVCVVVTECEPGDQQACGSCGARYCDTTGHWGPCVGEGCQPGQVEQGGSCGSCGTLARECQPQNCAWGDWFCVDEGPCDPGDVETGGSCGSGGHEERLCSASCQWELWTCEGEGVCTSGDVETGGSCGNCGTLQRTCTAGAWGSWSCVGQGVCLPNDSQTGAACGNCGVEQRSCNSQCQWGGWTCLGEGACVAGSTQTGAACQGGGVEERTCEPATCQWGAWTCNGGCPVAGHLGSGENGDACDAATQDEKWRCVFSTTLNAWVSQVCRDYYQPGVLWQWVNYAISPLDCAACCDTSSAACS